MSGCDRKARLAEENSRTYLNFIKASFQCWLLAIYCRLFLRLGGLDIALLLVKEIVWKVITRFFSGCTEWSHDALTSCRAQYLARAGLH